LECGSKPPHSKKKRSDGVGALKVVSDAL
jgi:hypothetical protein